MLHPGRPATLANWQRARFNRWTFLHVDRVVPTAAISRGGAPVAPFAVRERAVLDLPVTRVDILGWVCERAAGVDMATLLSTLIWQKLGMENDAFIAIDSAGAAVHDGGLCATARDVARFGQLLLDDGRAASGEQVLPEGWARDVLAGAADGKDAFAATSSFDTGMPGGHYRHQLWVPFADGQVLLALGIHGQMLYVDLQTRTVGVKLSTWPMPQQAARFHDSLATFRAIAHHLAPATGHHQSQERP